MVCPHCGKKHPDGALFYPFTAQPVIGVVYPAQAIQAAPAGRPVGVGLSQPVPSDQKKALPRTLIILLGVGALLVAGCLVSVLSIIRSVARVNPEHFSAAVVRFSPADPWPNAVVEARESASTPPATSNSELALVLPTLGLPPPGRINKKRPSPARSGSSWPVRDCQRHRSRSFLLGSRRPTAQRHPQGLLDLSN